MLKILKIFNFKNKDYISKIFFKIDNYIYFNLEKFYN